MEGLRVLEAKTRKIATMNNKLTPYQNLSRVTLGLLLMMLLSTALNAKTVAADSICNAEYTYRIDSVGNIPVYTFSATYPNNQYTYEWNIGGSLIRTGSTIEHIFNDAGGWGVTLTAFSATDTCTSYQNVGAMPPPEDECFFNTWQINDSTYAVETWLPMFWEDMSSTIDFGDGTVVAYEPVHGEHITHTYDSAGTYTICQTMGANDCSYCKEIEFESTTIPTCNADFTYTIDSTGNIPVYTFSAINPNNQYSYEWRFNEGFPRTGASIEHIFADWDDWTGGEFDVTLTSYNQTDTCSTIQTIKAEFPPFDVCFFNTWQIDDSTYAIETSLPMYWEDMSSSVDFGDGTVIAYEPEIGEYITHSYNKPGTYTICQTMDTDDCSYCKEVSVGTTSTECPTTFNYELIDSLDGEYEYHFSPLEIDSTARYIWTFDLNEETEAFTANYTFTTPGTHEVNLQIYTDNSFCELSEYIDIEENVEPISCPTSFNYEIDSLNSLIYAFYPTEIDSAASYTWKIDSIDVSTNASFTYQFEEADQYLVSLSINKGDSLCNLAEVINVESSEVPITCPSSFNYQVDSLNTLEYSFGVEEYDTAATTYSWFINEEQVGYEAYFNYTFPEGGLYSVDLLIAYDASECLVSDSILVEAPIDSIVCPNSFNYQVDSLNTLDYSFGVEEYDTAATTYSWFINEEQVGYEAYFNYTFPEGALYSVDLLIAYDAAECLVSDSILVEAPLDSLVCPTSFNAVLVDSLNTLNYQFSPLEIDNSASYLWAVDGAISTEAVYTYNFPSAGNYDVTLTTVKEQDTCEITQTIAVMAGTLHIQGMLYADLVPVVGGSLLLYQEIDNRWTYSNQVSTTDGHFIFENLAPGTYLLHGMGDRTIHEAFIPTYFVNGVSWKDAFEIELTGSAEELKITLIKAQGLTNGHGRISATMNTDDFDSQIVLLKDRNSNETVKWTISEGDQFSFNQLPLGAYRITMEMPSESFSMNVDVTDNQPEVNLNLDMFNILSSDDVAQKEPIVYPTAVENEVFIHNPSPSSSELTIKVISMTGQEVLSRSVKIASNDTYQLSLSNLDRGMYIILTEDSEGHKNNYRIQK